MKPIKTLLVAMATCIALAGFSQPITYTVSVTPGQCDTIFPAGANGAIVDSFVVLSQPQQGTIVPAGYTYLYCPDSTFSGSDQMLAYGCFGANGFLNCDTVLILFYANSNCSINVSVYDDSTFACIGANRHYQAYVNSGSAPYTYIWSDNTTQSGACEMAPGQNLCVTVTDANGCTGTACNNNNGCQLGLSISTNSPCAGPLPGLIASVTGGVAPITYMWSNGVNTDVNCNLSNGTYCLSVVDANGCLGYDCYTINGPGNCSFYAQAQSPAGGQVYSFTSTWDSAYSPILVTWNFGDGSQGTGDIITHAFTNCGYYTVNMSIYYSNGDSCNYTDYVYACDSSLNNIPGCQAAFYAYIDSNSNGFQFIDYSAYNPVSWFWDFGDGSSSTLQNPTHTYNSQGSWTVCLTTTDGNGCSSSTCQLVSNIPVQDLSAYLFHQTTVTPGFPVWVFLDYYNTGTILMNGTVTYRYPAGTTVTATSLTPASHDVANRLLTFNFSNLLPSSADYIYVELLADNNLTLGSIVEDTVWVAPLAGDINPADNMSFINDSVVGSWDPNDKAVSPKGLGERGDVPVNTTDLSYRIRFQNTGSAPAQNVLVTDVLNNNIDLTTVQVVNATHEYTWQIIGNTLQVSFANINLPDSGSNYAASQGAILVHAKLKPNLTPGTEIQNTAAIYFDFNDPVITNTVTTTLKTDATGISDVNSLEFAMLPNPANTQVYVKGDFDKNATYEVMNPLGQLMTSGSIQGTTTGIAVADLSAGVYLVKIKSGNQTGTKRLLIAR
ncbi:MAG: PKD domain-containing protein [Chitinophagales bacterium]